MASRVQLLPENLINRIAAGEVVERPASVLKELVENSLDAGATRVEIDFEAGGRRLIRVSDNGCGLNDEELFLCLERHATSKLDPQSDLSAIGTLGFRGEALPSIASVSKMSITSSTGGESGHRIRIEGGRIIDMVPAAANRGTVVEVRDLFWNVPARRKFLKTTATETAHMVDTARRYALSRPDLRLVLRDGPREALFVDERTGMASRILKVLGAETASDLRRAELAQDDLAIEGWLAGPAAAARTPGSLFLFVLGRPVRDRLLTKAVVQGYGRVLPQGRWPAGVVFLSLDPAKVDVNVHPAKTEVRFLEPGAVFDALARAVQRAVDVSPLSPEARFAHGSGGAAGGAPARADSAGPPGPPNSLFPLGAEPSGGSEMSAGGRWLPPDRGGRPEGQGGCQAGAARRPFVNSSFSMGRPEKRLGLAVPYPVPPWMDETEGQAPPADGAAARPDAGRDGSARDPAAHDWPPQGGPAQGGSDQDGSPPVPPAPDPSAPDPFPRDPAEGRAAAQDAADAPRGGSGPAEGGGASAPAAGPPEPELAAVRPLAQLHRSYILAQGPKGLYIIDQHAAHERVVFNRLRADLTARGLPSQGLVLPATMDLGPHEALAADRLRGPLARLGFRLEPFGGATWILRGVPPLLPPGRAREALMEILAAARGRLKNLEGAGLEALVEELASTWLYSLACRAAVKSGDELAMPEMEALIRDLSEAGTGGHCPHGRPAVLSITLAELERRFGRS